MECRQWLERRRRCRGLCSAMGTAEDAPADRASGKQRDWSEWAN